MKKTFWENLNDIVNSKDLTLKEKQDYIDNFMNVLKLNLKTNRLEISETFMYDVIEIIIKHDPLLYDRMKLNLQKYKEYRKIKHLIKIDLLLLIILIILLGALSHKKTISENIFKIHILNFISTYALHDIQDAVLLEEVNQILIACIRNTRPIKYLGKNNLDRTEKHVWRCIQFILNELVLSGWVTIQSTYFFRDSTGAFGSASTPVQNVITLNKVINNSFLLPNLSIVLPRLIPENIENHKEEIHKRFIDGESKFEASEKLIKTLQHSANIPFKYNYKLFKEAVIDMKTPLFELYRTTDLSTLYFDVVQAKNELIEHRYLMKETYFYELKQMECFILYLEKFDLKIGEWYEFVIYKVNKLRSRAKIIEERESIYRSHKKEIDLIIPRLLKHIVSQIKSNEYDFKKTMDSFTIIPIKDLFGMDYDPVKLIQAKNEINSLFLEYDLKRLSNIFLILKSYDQKQFCFMPIWTKAMFSNQDEMLKKDKVLHKKKIEAISRYGNIQNLEFKKNIMKVFQNNWVYFTPHIAINQRLAFEGYAPNPHSGDLFRFSEVKPEKMTKRGLMHIKACLSTSFGNTFPTLTEHVEWVDSNDEKIKMEKNKKLSSYTYYYAYQKGLKNEPCGIMARVDESGSVLAILGSLAGCSYLKQITNFNKSDEKIETYTEIAKTFILPKVGELIEKWNKDVKIQNDECKKFICDTIKDKVLGKITEKKFIKYIIMPQAYNLTSKGVRDKIIGILKEESPNKNWGYLKEEPLINALALTIWHGVEASSPRVRRLRNIINQTQGIILEKIAKKKIRDFKMFSSVIKYENSTMSWDYKIRKDKKKNVWIPLLGYSKAVTIKVNSVETCSRQCLLSLLPLLIHSYDSWILKETILNCVLKSGFTPNTIHDCGECHPNNLDDLLEHFKQAFHTVFGKDLETNKELLEKVWLTPTLEHLSNFLDKEQIDNISENWKDMWYKNSTVNLNNNFKESVIETKEVLESTLHYFYE